jgi:4-hydroxybenzoate polyprenyltransferase
VRAADLAELVRLPAALSVPGDSLAGAATRGPVGPRSLPMAVASVCLYWSGMALNDYADRELDAVERPERPVPSGRVRAREALAIGVGLAATGVAAAGLAGGRPAARTAALLAGVVGAYDLVLKNGPAGPLAMGAARGLDVVLGAGGDLRAARLPAALMAAHTVGVTALSRGEVHGSSRVTAATVAASTLAAGVVAGLPSARLTSQDNRVRRLLPGVLAAGYVAAVGSAQLRAAADPSGPAVRRATGAGIRGMIPLQASLLARHGAPRAAVGLLASAPVARVASRVVSPT